MKSRRDEIMTRVSTVRSLPAAALRAGELLRNADVDMSDVSRAIQHDPGLAGNVLRLANSAWFGFPQPVDSVRDALVRLGTKQVMRVVMASAAASVMHGAVRGYDLPPGGLWQHSIAVALAAEQLPVVLGISVTDDMFTAGLLHDVGKTVLGTFVEVDAAPIMKMAFEQHISFEQAERRVLGTDHAEVGARLLDLWNLPATIVNVSRWHHEPEQASEPSSALDIVHTADVLALMYGIGTGRDGLNYRPSSTVISRLQINVDVMEDTACRVLETLTELRGMFAAATV